MTDHRFTNRLIHETSPYLQQHAHNPVDWYAWGEDALARARAEDKPILISIGYSACHWCHVMEHESFEDEATARVMNAHFINIKVDREERPDLDRIYQLAHQMLNGRGGGWPLNMFLTPDDHTPFFGGTYFPPEARHGMLPFTELLTRIATAFRERRADIGKQNAEVREAFRRMSAPVTASTALSPAPLEQARAQLESSYDARHGGFGGAPKFPHPTNLERLLRQYAHSLAEGKPDAGALDMARTTLHAMASGGIYDQLGGGFCRYSVDEYWMIPHFEKMLYDNAQLLPLYVDAHRATGDETFRRVAIETAEWTMREMQSPEGGYYSTLDADSEGHEGKFYVWTPDAVRALLTEDEFRVFAPRFGLDRPPNFEGKEWHLHVFADDAAITRKTGLGAEGIATLIASARAKLFAEREKRVRPGRDEKILTSWNGLMIGGMAHAGRFLGRTDFIESASRALDFVRATLWKDGRLVATYKDGKAHLNAYLDDYAFLLAGTLELLQAHWRTEDLHFAIELARTLREHFEDHNHGGFFFTSDDHETLLARMKGAQDDATPNGNGIATLSLARLGHLIGDTGLLESSDRALKALAHEVSHYPSAHGAMLNALEENLYPPETIVLRGDAAAMPKWIEAGQRSYRPRRLMFAIPSDAGNLPGILAQRASGKDVTAYICAGHTCEAPITRFDEFVPRVAM